VTKLDLFANETNAVMSVMTQFRSVVRLVQ